MAESKAQQSELYTKDTGQATSRHGTPPNFAFKLFKHTVSLLPPVPSMFTIIHLSIHVFELIMPLCLGQKDKQFERI